MRINVRGGTVDHGRQPLCESCRWSTVIRGPRVADEIVECNQLSYRNNRIPFPVTSCSDYSSRNQFDLDEMEKIALMIRAEPRRTQAGFGTSIPTSSDQAGLSDD